MLEPLFFSAQHGSKNPGLVLRPFPPTPLPRWAWLSEGKGRRGTGSFRKELLHSDRACIYTYMYVYVYVCMYIYIYIYIHREREREREREIDRYPTPCPVPCPVVLRLLSTPCPVLSFSKPRALSCFFFSPVPCPRCPVLDALSCPFSNRVPCRPAPSLVQLCLLLLLLLIINTSIDIMIIFLSCFL